MSDNTLLPGCTDVYFRANTDAERRKEMRKKMRNCRQQWCAAVTLEHTGSRYPASTRTLLQFASLLGGMLITSVTSRHLYPTLECSSFSLPTVVQHRKESLSSVLIKQLRRLSVKNTKRENSKLFFSRIEPKKTNCGCTLTGAIYCPRKKKRRPRWRELTSK